MQNTEAIHCMLVPSFFPPGYYAGFGIAALKERSPQEKGEASVGVDRESCSGVVCTYLAEHPPLPNQRNTSHT